MRVLGLAGSPRAWSSVTLKLVEAALRGAARSGADTEVVEAAHLNVGRCLGCGTCFSTGRCRQDDDLAYLLEKLSGADGIIIGCPAYAGGVTAQVENVKERMADVAHCRSLEGKYGAAICVSRNGDERYVLGHLCRFLDDCGVAVTGTLGVALEGKDPGKDPLLEAERLGADLAAAIKEQRRCPEHEGARKVFLRDYRDTIAANKDRWAHDYRYWREKGWLFDQA